MPGKSKHSRGKHPHKNKIKARQAVAGAAPVQSAQDASSPAVATAARPAATAVRTAVASKPARVVAAVDSSYIVGEIKRIAILTGIMVVLLVILSIIFK